MTSIEVPDRVAADVLSRYSALRIERGDSEPWPSELARQQRQDDMKAALTAALGAWVVPVGYRVSIPSEPELGHWIEDIGEVTHPDPETHTNLYSLRQEKPE
jgi:hypothetical protein